MKILLTAPIAHWSARYFPDHLLERLAKLGELRLNETGEQLSREDVMKMISDVDVVLTHWGSIQYDAEMLDKAPNLKLIAHCAGTVAHIASEESYKRGIQTLSANPIMCKYVAEWTLGAIINGLREFRRQDKIMRDGLWHRSSDVTRSLFDITIGLVGMGAIGRILLDLLAPFGCQVLIYDPFINEDALAKWPNARLASFEEVMHCPVVSLHASKTPQTYHMINAESLAMMPDGGLLINSARAALIDTEALIAELQSGRISAALDVFDKERCAQDERLLACVDNTLLQSHMAAVPAGDCMTEAIVEDIERFARGESMVYTVSVEKFRLMTQE